MVSVAPWLCTLTAQFFSRPTGCGCKQRVQPMTHFIPVSTGLNDRCPCHRCGPIDHLRSRLLTGGG